MKLYYSGYSPFARKVAIVAEFLGLSERIERIASSGNPLVRSQEFRDINPSGQIPVLVTDEGLVLYDSKVICAYLNSLSDRDVMGQGDALWRNLTEASLADTLVESGLQYRYEIAVRPVELRWDAWTDAWRAKITDGLAALDARSDDLRGRMDIGVISIICALAYVEWRFADLEWAARYPKLYRWFAEVSRDPVVAASAPD